MKKINIDINNKRSQFVIFLIVCLFGLGLFGSCANKLSIGGGEKDLNPPQLDTISSDENFKRNFSDDEFTLQFDEFIKVVDASEQIVISPPLRYNLSPVVRGKKVICRFNPEEELLENTTYTVQFGEAIQDITESNAIKNLRYVFSTGAVIDSMQMRVHVTDYETDANQVNVLVMLYETLSDTVIRSGRPIYFSRTDSSGVAIVENCRPGNFRIFALIDENKNYHLDLAEEKIGHIDSFISSSLDEHRIFDIQIYSELDPPYRIQSHKIDSQLISMVVGGDKQYLNWEFQSGAAAEHYWIEDTLFILHQGLDSLLYISSAYNSSDTLNLNKLSRDQSKGTSFSNINISKAEGRNVAGNHQLKFRCSVPVIAVDTQFIRFVESDTTIRNIRNLTVTSQPTRSNEFELSFKPDQSGDVTLAFLPGAIASWRGSHDTLAQFVRVPPRSDLSNLFIKMIDLDSTLQYIARFESSKGQILQEQFIENITEYNWNIEQILPLKYKLILITDMDKNGQLDGGWFETRQLPELFNSIEIDNLRPDWDVEKKIAPK